MCARTEPRGFTLVELLISLLLLGLVLSLVYGAFGQISGPVIQQRDELTEQQELRLLGRMISDDLQAAQWLENAAAKSEPIPTGIIAQTRVEQGKAFTDISFHTARPTRFYRTIDPRADPGLHEVGYRVEPSEDRSQLVLIRREDFYLDDDLQRDGDEVPLADHISAFLVEFLPPGVYTDPEREPWIERWNSPEQPAAARMPLAMRLTLARTDAQGRELKEVLEFNLPQSLKP